MPTDPANTTPGLPTGREGGHAARPPRLAPALFLLFLGTIWGLNSSIAKLGGMHGVAPIGFSAWQMSGAALLVALACRMKGLPIRFDGAHWRYYLLVGLIGTALPSVNLVNTLRHLPAGVLSLGLSMVPLFSYAMSMALGLERFDRLRALGILVSFAGVLLIVLPKASLPEPEDGKWFLIGLLTPFLYAFSSVAAAKFRPPDATSFPLAGGMLIVLGLVLWPTAIATGQAFLPTLTADVTAIGPASWSVLIAMAISAVAYFCYFEVVRMAGPVIVSLVGYIVACTGILWGMAIFDERHSPYVWAAVAVIFMGLALVNLRHGRMEATRPT
ncbi:DMT family transporter [Marivibrio halodurans]|uniref:DMT family transporter n=1 Tax=Marivibrio halodurans TaxID=2039722 RepID=A0A8J7V4H2_9PROT|nr:DMT family transporter [Marivibrio halodurans]MBP5859077.1 DMT family transporter [Marivibrio halodurans]